MCKKVGTWCLEDAGSYRQGKSNQNYVFWSLTHNKSRFVSESNKSSIVLNALPLLNTPIWGIQSGHGVGEKANQSSKEGLLLPEPEKKLKEKLQEKVIVNQLTNNNSYSVQLKQYMVNSAIMLPIHWVTHTATNLGSRGWHTLMCIHNESWFQNTGSYISHYAF